MADEVRVCILVGLSGGVLELTLLLPSWVLPVLLYNPVVCGMPEIFMFQKSVWISKLILAFKLMLVLVDATFIRAPLPSRKKILISALHCAWRQYRTFGQSAHCQALPLFISIPS